MFYSCDIIEGMDCQSDIHDPVVQLKSGSEDDLSGDDGCQPGRSGGSPFELKKLPCLTGRHLKEPILLPTLGAKGMVSLACDEEGLTLVRFGYREAWASQACIGRVCGGPLLDAAIKQVRDEVMKALALVATVKRADKTHQAASCRSALGVLSDSDDDGGNAGDPEAGSLHTVGLHDINYYAASFKAAMVTKTSVRRGHYESIGDHGFGMSRCGRRHCWEANAA